MSVIARIITRQLVNRPRFYRQIFIPPSQSKRDDYQQKSRWNKFLISSAGISTCIVAYELFKDFLPQFVPSMPQVAAATESTSRRAQVS